MTELFCPTCMDDREVRAEQIEEVLTVKNDGFKVTSNVAFCNECNTQVYSEELDGENLERAYNLYRDKYNIIQPQKLADLRSRYGLSQKAFARILGWGEITIHRYERGALPDSVHNSVLKLLHTPSVMAAIVYDYRGDLDARILDKVKARLDQFLSKDVEAEYEVAYENLVSNSDIDVFSGHIAFNLGKLVNMIRFFASSLGGVFKTKMNKLLWYSDYIHFKDYSVSMSGARYKALPYGPVPDNFEIIFAEMLRHDAIQIEEKSFSSARGQDDYIGEILLSEGFSAESKFSNSELTVLAYVVETFGNMNSKQISEVSHLEDAYMETERNSFIRYDLVNSMKWSAIADDEVPF